MIIGLLLAAGEARRFGAPKLVQPLRGKVLLRWSAETLTQELDATVAVLAQGDAIARAAIEDLPRMHIVTNPDARRGIGSSIACGIAALPPGAEAVLIALADEPGLRAHWLAAILERYRATIAASTTAVRPAIVAPTFHGTRRHPVLFDRQLFPELAELDGDRGARDVIDRHRRRVAVVEVNEPAALDVDTPEDLARLEREAQFTAPPSPRNS